MSKNWPIQSSIWLRRTFFQPISRKRCVPEQKMSRKIYPRQAYFLDSRMSYEVLEVRLRGVTSTCKTPGFCMYGVPLYGNVKLYLYEVVNWSAGLGPCMGLSKQTPSRAVKVKGWISSTTFQLMVAGSRSSAFQGRLPDIGQDTDIGVRGRTLLLRRRNDFSSFNFVWLSQPTT